MRVDYSTFLNVNAIFIALNAFCKSTHIPLFIIYLAEGESDMEEKKKTHNALEEERDGSLGRMDQSPNQPSREGEEDFTGIVGYQDIKDQLNEIVEWYGNEDLRFNDAVWLPKGVLFVGVYGVGKSSFARALAQKLGYPSFYCDGGSKTKAENLNYGPCSSDHYENGKSMTRAENLEKAIDMARSHASHHARSVVIINEIDLLLEKDNDVKRLLLNAMDEDDGIFYIATLNSSSSIDKAFCRSGRFDRVIHVNPPSCLDAKGIYAHYLARLGMNSTILAKCGTKDQLFIGAIASADIKAIVNDCFLRKGASATLPDLRQSFDRIANGNYVLVRKEDRRWSVAVHEIGHLVCARSFHCFCFQQANFENGEGRGSTHFYDADDDRYLDKQDTTFGKIVVALGGYYAEKQILKRAYGGNGLSEGVIEDLADARTLAAHLVNTVGYKGPERTLPRGYQREESGQTKYENEKAWRAVMRKAGRKAKRIVCRYRKLIPILADMMMENGGVSADDFSFVFERCDQTWRHDPKIRHGALSYMGKPVLKVSLEKLE